MSITTEKPHHLNEYGEPIDAHGFPIPSEVMDDSGWQDDPEEDGVPVLPPELLKALEKDGIIDEAGNWLEDGRWVGVPFDEEKEEKKEPVAAPAGGTKSDRVASFGAAVQEDLDRLRATVGNVMARSNALAEERRPNMSFSPVVKMPTVVLDLPANVPIKTLMDVAPKAEPTLTMSPVSYQPPDQELVEAQRFSVAASSVHIAKSRTLPMPTPPVVHVAAPIVNVNVSPTPVTVENHVPAPVVNVENNIPAPIVNVAAAEAPTVNVAAPNVQVDVAPPPAPIVNVAAPNVQVDVAQPPAPIVNVAAPNVHVEAPNVNVKVAQPPAPIVNVAAPNVKVAAPEAPVVNVYNEVKLPPPRARTATVTSPDGTVSEIKIGT